MGRGTGRSVDADGFSGLLDWRADLASMESDAVASRKVALAMSTSSKAPRCIILDYETKGIELRPKYPPRAVSVAIKWPDTREYELLAWGHGDGSRAAGNNCTEKEARARTKRAYDSRWPILTQYGTFDHDISETHWELPLPPWKRCHDTMYLLFLWDPHSPTLSLKPCAERYLGMPPEEQDRMKEWILANVPEARRKPSEWGAYIWQCPYQVVKPYHKGDLVRTGRLFEHLYPLVTDAGMGAAYDRERRLMPILLRNARRGMRVDLDRLMQDIPKMRAGIEKTDTWLRKKLGIENIDSDRQLGEALVSKGLITNYVRTKKGQISTSKANLTIDKFTDKKVYQALQYRGQMSTALDTFAEPWAAKAASTGSLYPNWSQVRAPRGGGLDTSGARSGRIICSDPNFLNIPGSWKKAITAGYAHPAWLNVPELPYMRQYILPHKGKQWGRRDSNQQEVRIFAHYEEGPVMQGFLANPRHDVHEGVRAEEEAALVGAGLRESFDRGSAKITVFGAFYGQGLTGLMRALRLRDPEERDVGKAIHAALHRAVPSISELSNALKTLFKNGEPLRTWGGRLYYCEPPGYSEEYNRDMTYEYKAISYLIQSSGADIMKEVIIRYDAHPKRQEDMITTVYDELDVDLPMSKKGVKQEMDVVKECIESIELDVPMLSDGEIGPNWGSLEAYTL